MSRKDIVSIPYVGGGPEFGELVGTRFEREDDAFDALTESTATDGLARLKTDGADCVASDYGMSGTNGLDFS